MSLSASPSRPQPNQPCPCGSGKNFADCCSPLLAGQRTADSAEQLMRSRFTAHVLHEDRYLHDTCLPTSKTAFVPEDEGPRVAWTRLAVHSHDLGPAPDQAFVDFSAFFTGDDESEQVLQEKSEFRRISGRWFFTKTVRQGPAPLKSAYPKVGRNDPCPCGSGKKYKQCCLQKG